MAKRITLPQLIEKIQNRKLTPQETRDYFLSEPNAQQPFDFKTYVNAENVDVRNFESLARNADHIVAGISRAPAGRKKAVAKKGMVARKIVAEGDSWFRLPPIWPYPDTCIDYLQDDGYPIVNLAHWGHTLEQILAAGEFWPYIDNGHDLLLFSAGGNDLLGGGQLASFLNLFDVGHSRPADAAYYVKQDFYDNLDWIISNLETGLILPMAARRANKKIIMHGYDYALPQANGQWLGGPMWDQGLHPTFRAALCRAIIRLMIDAFNARLRGLASRYPDVFMYLDLRGTIGANEWYDELHGKDAAAKKIARKFSTKIDATKVTASEKAISKLFAPAAAAA